MNLFYIPELIPSQPVLNEQETRHCAKVLRKKKGDIIYVTDGKGRLSEAEILQYTKKNTFLKIVSTVNHSKKRDYSIHIAIAPTKNIDRFEWFIEKTTEIGVDEITPIFCRNSERKIIKHERTLKVVESAMKQSFKTYLPKFNHALNFKDFIYLIKDSSNKYIAHCYDSPKEFFGKSIVAKKEIIVLIGPEGDFSKEEVDLAVAFGVIPVSLSKSRLRTETAGVVACTIPSIIGLL